jgi:septal ring factor EnvC (AmiA/AmiB activator)
MSDLNTVRTDVEILKKDVSNIQGLLSRLDTAIDKIADASNGISKILAVHETQIKETESSLIERKRLAEKEVELLHRRISDMKEESIETDRRNHDEIMTKLDNMGTEVSSELKTMSERVTILERWKWWIMGGSWVIGFVIATLLQVGGLIELFK